MSSILNPQWSMLVTISLLESRLLSSLDHRPQIGGIEGNQSLVTREDRVVRCAIFPLIGDGTINDMG